MLKIKKQEEKSPSTVLSINPKFKVGDEVFVMSILHSDTRVHWRILGPVEISKIEVCGNSTANGTGSTINYRFYELEGNWSEDGLYTSIDEIVELYKKWIALRHEEKLSN